MKAFYLCYFAAVAAYTPYLGLYLRAIHLDGARIGLVASLAPFIAVLSPPLWGTVSDRYGWRQRLLTLSLLTAALIAPTVAFAHSFVALLALIGVLGIALSATAPLADATTLDWLRRHGGTYGGVRVYGSCGYMVVSLVVGALYAGQGLSRLFPLYGALLFVTFLVSLTAPRQSEDVVLVRGEGIGVLLRDRVLVVFLLLCALGYGTYATYNTFFALYLKGLGADTHVVGAATALASASELPVMALAGPIMARIGVKGLLLLGLGAACARWTAYGLLHDYRIAVAVGLLHGVSFAGFYVAGVTVIDRRVPARLRATGQTLFNGAMFGLGSVIGSNVFGMLYDHLHANGMFLVAAGVCALAIVGLTLFIPVEGDGGP